MKSNDRLHYRIAREELPRAKITIDKRGTHPALDILNHDGCRKRVYYPCSPSDSYHGLRNWRRGLRASFNLSSKENL